MQPEDDRTPSGVSPLTGSAKVVAAIAILLVAALAILVVLDAISLAMFGEYAGKVLLTGCIVILASIGIGLLSRIGKS
jgi:hypothetical protein